MQPREQNLKESRRLLSQTWQVFVTPLPGLGCGLSFKKTTLALLIMYVWTEEMSKYFWISFTLITSWYDDLLICPTKQKQITQNQSFIISRLILWDIIAIHYVKWQFRGSIESLVEKLYWKVGQKYTFFDILNIFYIKKILV